MNHDEMNEAQTPQNEESALTRDELLQPDSAIDLSEESLAALAAEQTEIERLQAEVAALKERLLREVAENDNLRKRQERELANAHKFANEGLLKALFPVLDSLVLGLKAAQENLDKPEAMAQFVEGSEMTLKLLGDTLKKYGVEEICPEEGEKFNPDLHEAVTMLPNPAAENNTVLHVTQRGYALNGRTVRAAQVVVVKNS